MHQKRYKKEGTVAFSENGPGLSMAHSHRRVRNAHAVRGRDTRDKRPSRGQTLSSLATQPFSHQNVKVTGIYTRLKNMVRLRRSIPICPRLSKPLPLGIHIQNPLTGDSIIRERRLKRPRDGSLP